MSDNLFINESILQNKPSEISGEYVNIGNEEFYKISNYDQMRPFFISLVSDSDLWMFISTTGGLTAGRKDENSSLFPYYTDDKLEDAAEFTGSKTILKVVNQGKTSLWEPFSNHFDGIYQVSRNLYKNFYGNKLIFEEVNHDLGITFCYSWQFSQQFGIVKKSSISNQNDEDVMVSVLDGIQNLLPAGVNPGLQSAASNLVNAYKKNELDAESGLGIYMLSAMIVDKAEPSESLMANTVWTSASQVKNRLLSSRQLASFRKGIALVNEEDVRAERGAYFIEMDLKLSEGQENSWYLVAEVNQDHGDVAKLIKHLKAPETLIKAVENDIASGTENLSRLVGKADGLQLTGDKLSVGRHYSNVMFNIMRGGIFEDGYDVESADLIRYFKSINSKVFDQNADFLNSLPETIDYTDLIQRAAATENADVLRICVEYLPISFSRRHGDPSRPWNKFSIVIKDENGDKIRNYQGNWRDIFQNWEALSHSFPEYILSMITKFVNASTLDGYNPYRITRSGIDWEVIEPDDPWSYIGYWGDHQIIYLQKLMEVAFDRYEDDFLKLLAEDQFVYANVPYRIKSYEAIKSDPQDTIDYDHDVQQRAEARVNEFGADGKLVFAGDDLLKANLIEKLLVSFLAKMTNFIPEGGIWMNTQRPEWNDANNALVGNGVSMVTLYYMRRFVVFVKDILAKSREEEFNLNQSVIQLMNGVQEVLQSNESILNGKISDSDREVVVDALGKAGAEYRAQVYNNNSTSSTKTDKAKLIALFESSLNWIDHSITANKRSDGLYHAYNLIQFDNSGAHIEYMYEMLEGQVAVLSAGKLDLKESLEVLDALKASDIYREDQYSYMLYPNRTLPRFLEKNTVAKEFVNNSQLAQSMIANEDRSILYQDVSGEIHWNDHFRNAKDLKKALEGKSINQEEYNQFLKAYESTFNHKAFTGRSGTFYGYEGLGSIYWHMVSKLLLATQENIHSNWETHKGTPEMGKMIDHYYEIRAGIGMNKSPELYGSFPTDPYSHTPGNKGVQQPGMTGQVKEDVLNRWAELGISVKSSRLTFNPAFLSENEFLTEASKFTYFNTSDKLCEISVDKGELAFTYCQVPVVYKLGDVAQINLSLDSGEVTSSKGNTLDMANTQSIFKREGKISKIEVIISNTN